MKKPKCQANKNLIMHCYMELHFYFILNTFIYLNSYLGTSQKNLFCPFNVQLTVSISYVE